MKIKLRRAQSVLNQVDAIKRQIAERAFDLFKRRGGVIGQAFEDWLAAESEVDASLMRAADSGPRAQGSS